MEYLNSIQKKKRVRDQDDIVEGEPISSPSHHSVVEEVEDNNDADKQQSIVEEYKLWKNNAPFLYDLVVTHVLEWPTLTCQWFPDLEDQPDNDYNLQRVLLGTQTNGEENEHIIIANVKTPKQKKSNDRQDNENKSGGYGASEGCRIQISQRINHAGEVNRARYVPQNPDLIGTVSSLGHVNIFDRTKHPNDPAPDGKCSPEIRLVGHSEEPLDLEWNRAKEGHLLTCAKDKAVCLWDISAYTKSTNELAPIRTFNFHKDVVGGISWLPQSPNVFASCSDDRLVAIWDVRKSDPNPAFKTEAHKSEVNVVQFNPFGEFLFATGGNDGVVRLWDLRNINLPLHDLEGHTDSVVSIGWSPTNETILATGGNDRRAHIWDISLIGMEQNAEEAEDGAPELMFIHGGHTDPITDLSWNLHQPWTLATSSSGNSLHYWQMASNIYETEEISKLPSNQLQ